MATCFLCDAEMLPCFKTRDHLRPAVATEYEVVWCAACSFGAVNGGFSPQDVSAFYTQGYYTHVAPDHSATRATSFLDRLRVHLAWRIDRGIDLSPNEVKSSRPAPTLCDVGCGSGQALAAFREAGYQVLGIEPDPAARAIAAASGPVLDGTAESIPEQLVGRQFDLVLLSHVLEHCIHPAQALRNVRRLLAPGGTAIFEVPNNAALALAMYGPTWFFADIPRHLQFFTELSLRKALSQAGLRVTRVLYTGYTRQFSPSWLAAQQQIRANTGLQSSSKWRGSPWRLLAQTAFAPSAQKYDSIRIHAVPMEMS